MRRACTRMQGPLLSNPLPASRSTMIQHSQAAMRHSLWLGARRSYVARRFHSGETEAPLLLAATSPPATIDPALYLPPALRQAPFFTSEGLAVLHVT